MASKEELERQLVDLEKAYQAQQVDEASYEQGRAYLMRMLSQQSQPAMAAGSDFFATGGGAPPTATGVVMHESPGGGGDLTVGQVLRDRYRVEGKVGEGGMGVVYHVHDMLRDRPLAMKLLHPNFPPEAQGQLKSELSLQERIRHKGVVATYDLDMDPQTGRLFYTMEYVDGGSLESLLDRAKASGRVPPLSIEDTTQLMQGLCSVLQAAHEEGIVHRDLKPQNILLPTGGGVKLLDFGIARDLSESSQHTGYTGTPIYMAPEQLRGGGEITPAADIYSIGVMLYQFLTGQLFYGRMPGPREWLEEQGIVPTFPAAVDDVVFKALDFSPQRRYQSAPELFEAFIQALGSESSAANSAMNTAVPAGVAVETRARSWSQAASVTDQINEQLDEPLEDSGRFQSRLRGRAPVEFGDAPPIPSRSRARVEVIDNYRGPKKKRGLWWKIPLFLFLGAPVLLVSVGAVIYAVVGKRPSPPKVPEPVTNSNNTGDSKNTGDFAATPPIDLAQIDEAFRTTTVPAMYGNLRKASQIHNAWMFEFERAVNEIYLGSEIVSIQARRVLNKTYILGYLEKNQMIGYQAGTDTLLFRVVQENAIVTNFAALSAKLRQMRLRMQQQNSRNFLDDDSQQTNTRQTWQQMRDQMLNQVKAPMKYAIEDGGGWVYKRGELTSESKFHMLARQIYLPTYTTMPTRRAFITGYLTTYRRTSAFTTRSERYNQFVRDVSARRAQFYRNRNGSQNGSGGY